MFREPADKMVGASASLQLAPCSSAARRRDETTRRRSYPRLAIANRMAFATHTHTI
jgi:gas vesicle protein